MLRLYLVGPARIWLSGLEKNSIFCWFDLKNAFEKHFREKITVEVVPFKAPNTSSSVDYHKFTEACYISNKLKIPGPKGATYQRTMQRCLKDQIGRNVHVDDIAVMTRKGSDLISDLRNL
ncbi:hypothetical protein QYE76_047305 [Lolium multiflorum]|uniref:Uncharacterized protein n=1 Tax=Lolium multiflorum TaxID=4521 RepID=A0AAD8TRH5_LOLMU|nr:hypothetical protein QYE76_047305 [Lolium multiflorum]